MKLSKRIVPSYLYKRKSIINNVCQLCLSKNIFNNSCIDCETRNIDIYYLNRDINICPHTLNMSFELSPTQKDASLFFLNHFINRKNAFLYAVCGSGKTEIMYEAILRCLNDGLKPIVVIPRKEIVKELYDRLKSVFIDTKISFLDGTHHDDSGELLISTVHQLINYEDEFDLLILDEADAYPFAGNEYLHRILYKSVKKNGVIFFMSATIKEKIKWDTYTLNRRYHLHDLSLPTLYKMTNINMIKSDEFKDILSNKERKHIIYVPTIDIGNRISELLEIPSISSKSKNINTLLNNFKTNPNFRNIISTTILERGITIPNTDVIILYASDKVFTYQTIIQMCGRVGRKTYDPTGSIYIFYSKNSFKFNLVNNYIKRMNRK
ncbi:MAG: DEAD/DEAH box helicase family protein [Gammaproteobacteria bacterium]|nr:DEAD/DEAH box helicase family protein [Gammaproteobacteria bacterium]